MQTKSISTITPCPFMAGDPVSMLLNGRWTVRTVTSTEQVHGPFGRNWLIRSNEVAETCDHNGRGAHLRPAPPIEEAA